LVCTGDLLQSVLVQWCQAGIAAAVLINNSKEMSCHTCERSHAANKEAQTAACVTPAIQPRQCAHLK
jgi:hypothetical protein